MNNTKDLFTIIYLGILNTRHVLHTYKTQGLHGARPAGAQGGGEAAEARTPSLF